MFLVVSSCEALCKVQQRCRLNYVIVDDALQVSDELTKKVAHKQMTALAFSFCWKTTRSVNLLFFLAVSFTDRSSGLSINGLWFTVRPVQVHPAPH